MWWDVWREIVGRKCGGMFRGKVFVESVGDVWKEGVDRKCGGMF